MKCILVSFNYYYYYYFFWVYFISQADVFEALFAPKPSMGGAFYSHFTFLYVK